MIDRQRVLGALPVGPTWTTEEVRSQLRRQDLDREHIVPIPVSLADLDPQVSRKRQLQRRGWAAGVIVIVAALAVLLVLRPGGAGWTALVSPLIFSLVFWPVAWAQRERIGPAAVQDSQAEVFVRALTNATTELRGVRQRWFAFNDHQDALLVTQEEQWGYEGARPILQLRWSGVPGAILDIAARSRFLRHLVRFEFADKSSTVLDLTPAGRRELLETWG